MPHTITKEEKGFIRTFTGSVSSGEYLAEIERTQAREDFYELHFVINDFTNAKVDQDWFEKLDFIAAITKVAKT